MIQLEERLYTSTEVAEILGVSLRSVYRYLEEGKLDAEIKTATGRHRFSKKNIVDFLYPTGQVPPTAQSLKTGYTSSSQVSSQPKSIDTNAQDVILTPQPSQKSEISEEKEVKQEVPVEEPVDWLAKFREAAKKFKEETVTQVPSEPRLESYVKPVMDDIKPSEPVKYSAEPAFAQEHITNFDTRPVERIEREEKPAIRTVYYRSGLGGLKDIAQNIDKSARNAGLEYAFSLNAGLSLFKPIKPFSVLHAYVKPQDLPFFERALSLTPSEESTAQLCLLVSNDVRVYLERQELHGLFVVSKQRLLDDVQKYADSLLLEEAKSVL